VELLSSPHCLLRFVIELFLSKRRLITHNHALLYTTLASTASLGAHTAVYIYMSKETIFLQTYGGVTAGLNIDDAYFCAT